MTATNTPTTGVVWADAARHAAFDAWLAPLATRLQLLPQTLRPASADASFRRYLRLDRADGTSLIVMDAPPDKEDCASFVKIQGLMAQAGLCVPQILDWDAANGFMLLNDLGSKTVIEALNPEKPQDAEAWYRSALEVLLDWQLASMNGNVGNLPPYNEALLRRELQLFPDWYIDQYRQFKLDDKQQATLTKAFDQIVAHNLQAPSVYVHRDFMTRNLMQPVTEGAPLGVLDFQDAVYGPVTYDVTCLFKDAFLSWPPERVRGWLEQYWQQAQAVGIPVQAQLEDFLRASDLMGVQRHLKVIGIFARICHRDGKPKYLGDVPRFFAYIHEVLARRPELAELGELLASLPQAVDVPA